MFVTPRPELRRSDWDALFALDKHHAFLRNFAATVDGKYQTLGAKDGRYNLENFFGLDPELKALVANLSVADVDGLRRGGHDFAKLYAAFAAAREHRDGPTVILAKTKKGFGMGAAGESRNIAHQAKKLDLEALKSFRDRFSLPLSDDDLDAPRFIKLPEESVEVQFVRARRAALGGPLPERRAAAAAIEIPPLRRYANFALDAGGREMSTTVVLMLSAAAQRNDRCLVAAPNVKAAAAQKIAGKLIASGLVKEIKAKPGAPVWRRNDEAGQSYALKLTAAGAKAIAIDESAEPAHVGNEGQSREDVEQAGSCSQRPSALARRNGPRSN